MKTSPTSWNRLVTAARLAPADQRDETAPHGFATRVSALAMSAGEPTFATLFARFSLRSLGVCGLLMVLGVTLNLSSVVNAFESDSSVTLNDPVAEWLNASS
ncbi:hypothetical protein [Rariglobus hedericola]|uniref:Uncharacterized protein n=1 Tax=Rariglobus hedericola TaxID=2597822 RepID=A0A556QLH8_9BACT|nr:hypothetical protein [Rariglobus hedericola]TSJ77488.1 hypothetical protein FPL22_15485 [Rariglobus hedericola]